MLYNWANGGSVHPSKQAIAIIRQDYYELMNRDACAAALLNIFEYWANAAISAEPSVERPWVGARPVREFEQLLLGIATDKQIRKRLAILEKRGFITVRAPEQRGAAKSYRVNVPEIQHALDGQMTAVASARFGQITDGGVACGSDDRCAIGQMTDGASVKRPIKLRLNDRVLKRSLKEFKEEEREGDSFSSLNSPDRVLESEMQPVTVGCVRYSQPPESINLMDLWEEQPRRARQKLKASAPGHMRLEMVARGLGHWWVGPEINDFDEHLVAACRNRKRKCQQPCEETDAKSYLNNMLRNGDWGNLALRCKEAEALKCRENEMKTARRHTAVAAVRRNPFEWSEQERRASALGLVQYKLGRGDVEGARAIAQKVGIGCPMSMAMAASSAA